MAEYAADPARLADLSARIAAFRLACAFERLKRAGRLEDVFIDDPFDPEAEVSVELTEARWQSANRESPPRDAPPESELAGRPARACRAMRHAGPALFGATHDLGSGAGHFGVRSMG